MKTYSLGIVLCFTLLAGLCSSCGERKANSKLLINEVLADSGVQSFEACPGGRIVPRSLSGLIITGTSPKFFRNMSWIIYILGYAF